MVLLNMYGKIEQTIISKKLGIGLCNPAPVLKTHCLKSKMDIWITPHVSHNIQENFLIFAVKYSHQKVKEMLFLNKYRFQHIIQMTKTTEFFSEYTDNGRVHIGGGEKKWNWTTYIILKTK